MGALRTGPASYGINSSFSSSPLMCSRGLLGTAFVKISATSYITGPFEDITSMNHVWPPFFIGNQSYANYFYDEAYPYSPTYPAFRDQSISTDDDGVLTAKNTGGTPVTPWYPNVLRGYRSTGTTYAHRDQAKLLGLAKGVLCQYAHTPGGVTTSTVPTDYSVIDNGKGGILLLDVENIPADGEQTWCFYWGGLTLDDFPWY